MGVLKIGDKVKIRTWESMEKEFGTDDAGNINVICCFTKEMKKLCGNTYVIRDVLTDCYGRRKYKMKGLSWNFSEDMFDPDFQERKIQPQKIVITTDGKTTTAKLYDGKSVVKTATAKCSHDDVFDFKTGAKIAFDRLLGIKDESFDWTAFKNDEFFVQVTEDNFGDFIKEAKKHHCYFARHREINPFKDNAMRLILDSSKAFAEKTGILCAPNDIVYIGYQDDTLRVSAINVSQKSVFVW